jgi:hypothetical protein
VQHTAQETVSGFQGLLRRIFGQPNQGALTNQDLYQHEIEQMKNTIADSWHHFVAVFREDERIACRIHELDEQAKRRHLVESKNGRMLESSET